MVTVGIISDTHGLLRPEALRALRTADHIVHAGDVGDPAILKELRKLGPVTAVRGNTDRGGWTSALPETDVVELEESLVFVIHDLASIDLDPRGAGFQVVVSGHTHVPEIRHEKGILYVNPGSAGPARWSKPVTLAMAEVDGRSTTAHIIPLVRKD